MTPRNRAGIGWGIGFAALVTGSLTGTVYGQSKAGTTIGQFLLVEPSARVAGMGNAGVSLFDGVQSIFYNPAAAAQMRDYGLTFSHAEWLADISFDYVAGTLPVGRAGAVFASVTALNSGEIDVRTVEQPLGTGERYTVSNLALGVGYGRRFTDRVAAGLQVNYVQESIWNTAARTFTLNLGTLYRLSPDGLHLGAGISNFGTNARYSGRDLRIVFDNDPSRSGDNNTLPAEEFTDRFSVPLLFRVGIGKPYTVGRDGRLLLVADALHPADNTESVSLGAEYSYRSTVALRAGYQNLFLEDSEIGLTLGAGIRGSLGSVGYGVDYAWADQGRLGDTHRFTLDLTVLGGH